MKDNYSEIIKTENLDRKKNKHLIRKKQLTDDILYDFFNCLDYIPLSLKEEKSYIKKAQLSFYDDIDDDRKFLFIKNYASEVPKFREKYENANLEEKEKLLNDAILNSREWRDWFVSNNQRLVLNFVLYYKDTCRNLTLMDLVQEGNFGLLKALEKYDLSKNCRFSSYSAFWIKHSISKAIEDDDCLIRQPVYFYKLCKKFNSTKNSLYKSLHRIPTAEEISEASEISLEIIQKIENYEAFQFCPSSLNEPIFDDDYVELGDRIASDEKSIEEMVEDKILKDELIDIIKNSDLSEREIEIIFRYYGLNGRKASNFSQIGNCLGISRARAGQLEKSALKKMANDYRIREICPEKIKMISGKNYF